MISTLFAKFKVIDHNLVLDNETKSVTNNPALVKLMRNFTPVPSRNNPGQLSYKAKGGMRYRDIMIGGAKPRKGLPDSKEYIKFVNEISYKFNRIYYYMGLFYYKPKDINDALGNVLNMTDLLNNTLVIIENNEHLIDRLNNSIGCNSLKNIIENIKKAIRANRYYKYLKENGGNKYHKDIEDIVTKYYNACENHYKKIRYNKE